jgi:hypothetical protein
VGVYAYSNDENMVRYIARMLLLLTVSFLFDSTYGVLSGKAHDRAHTLYRKVFRTIRRSCDLLFLRIGAVWNSDSVGFEGCSGEEMVATQRRWQRRREVVAEATVQAV